MIGYKHVTPRKPKTLGLRESEPALSDSESKVDYIAVKWNIPSIGAEVSDGYDRTASTRVSGDYI